MISWKRYLPYVIAALFFVALWTAQYIQVNTDPRAAYSLVNPKPAEVLQLNVPVHAENHTSKGDTKANAVQVQLWEAERTSQGQTAVSSYMPESSNPTGEYVQKATERPIPVRNNVVDETFMREREKVYEERRRRVQEVCEQLGPAGAFASLSSVLLRRFRWLMSHRFIMCFNAKVGTTTWSQYLLERSRTNAKSRMNMHLKALRILQPPYKRNSPKSLAMMKRFSKVMIVRHPFTRIASAYLDKMNGSQFQRLQRNIVSKYATASSPSTSPRHPTFEEFVRFLVARVIPQDDVTTKYRKSTKNVHWSPYYVNCAPCNIAYDVILSMETINEDTRYVSERFGLELEEGVWKNRKSNSSEVTAISLFKALPRNLTLALHQRYHVDFHMFGYDVTPFLAET